MNQDTLLPDQGLARSGKVVAGAPLRRRSFLRHYAMIFFAPILLTALFTSMLHIFLWRVQETTGPISAAQLQERTGDLYGPALIYRPFAYKLERYRLRSPDILLVGSSRVMPFAGEVFTAPVLNAGGSGNTLEQAAAFTRAAVALHKPKAVLLGLDFWWFNPNRGDEIGTTGDTSDDVDLSLTQLVAPLRWISDGNLHASSFFEAFFPFQELSSGIGAFAKFGGRGWDIYGRYDYGTLLDGGMKSDDRQFKRTLKRLQSAKNTSKMSVRAAPSADAIKALRELVSELQAQSIEVTLLLPPLANAVREAIEQNAENRLIPLWRDAVIDLGFRVFDFTDSRLLKSNDCEFVDGFHGGEVIYLRILDAISNFDNSALAKSIDRDMISGLITANSGHARIAELRDHDVPPEVDFLDLGCQKTL